MIAARCCIDWIGTHQSYLKYSAGLSFNQAKKFQVAYILQQAT